jgi:putative pyruvate formate lyase activating enzyme
MYPSYLELGESGELERRALALTASLHTCEICPHRCGIDRAEPLRARCGIGLDAVVASAHPHFGEEPPISGRHGSGTIFFAGCSLRCWFCQNAEISHGRTGRPMDAAALSRQMLLLQAAGCHNINLVTPTHVVPQIVAALVLAARAGLRLPLVYNSGGYDRLETLRMLEGVVDIYMPDLKYADPLHARRLSGAPDYPEVARTALREMHRQVGDLEVGADGVARRGLLVRHLVLPGDQSDTEACLRFLAEEISSDTYVNVMDQYRPLYRAHRRPEVARPLRPAEFEAAMATAQSVGLRRAVR